MPVSLFLWRLLVGIFNGSTLCLNKSESSPRYASTFCSSLSYFLLLLLLLSGDVHPNPGQRKDKYYNFSLCYWNVGSLQAHNFSKLTLLASYNSIYKYDMICLSETFLDSSFIPNDERLSLDGYEIVRSDHPNDVKRGGVCVYVKSSLAANVCNFNKLTECFVIEIVLNNKKGYIVSLYRSPSQTNDEFDEFIINFDLMLHDISSLNPSFVMILGDMNAKSSSWCSNDSTSNEGFHIESLTSFYGFSQLISNPTHILPTTSSCIDLIFTDQPNLIMDSGVYSSLHPNCHHQIVFSKINLKIEYPPPYERIIWDYKHANTESINQAINTFDWENLFQGKHVDEQLFCLNNTLLNIFKNYIPNKLVTFNDSDPPWINNHIKTLIKLKNQMYNHYIQNGKKLDDYLLLETANKELSEIIERNRNEYFNGLATKLNNPQTSAKSYWKILKTFTNGKKIPSIPPLLVNSKYVSNFSVKANIFNKFFAEQCTNVSTTSAVPDHLNLISDKKLSQLFFDSNDIITIIRNLNPNKAHGHDGISIRMIQMSCISITKPLYLFFKNCFDNSVFSIEWKKGNIIPIHKKGCKQVVSNYRPISLLPIFSKIFERIIFNSVYNYMEQNKLFNLNQSGFRPGDSCIHQLISITHNIHKSFDANPSQEVRGVFLDISKAFDRVWHDGLLYKIKNFGIEGKLFNLIESFLANRYQRVTLNGQSSDWLPVKAGVPQGSILGPLLFLCYINDLPDNLISNPKLFADDTALFSNVNSPAESENDLNQDLSNITNWAKQWKMLFNPDVSKPPKEVIFSKKIKKTVHPSLLFNKATIQTCSSEKHLGLILDEKLNFKQHLDEKISKSMKIIGVIKKLRPILPRHSLISIYKSFVRPNLDYGDAISINRIIIVFPKKLNPFNITQP